MHIGLGKTATSSLQAHVFPRLAEDGVVGCYNPPKLMQTLDGVVNGWIPEAEAADRLAEAEASDRLAEAGDVLLSNETLVEWDPTHWEMAADRLLRLFGPDTVILLTIREPDSYLRSLYQQMLHGGKIRPPQDALLPTDTYCAVRRFVRPGEIEAIDIDAFDLSRLIELYAARFRSVVLLPFETLSELRFLGALWSVPEADRARLARAFAEAPRVNTSYSRLAVQLTLFRERILAGLGLRTRSVSDTQLDQALAHARGLPPPAPGRRVVPSWSRLMRLLSRHGPKAAYTLPSDLYLGRHRDRNAAVYAALRATPDGYVMLRDGVSDTFKPATTAERRA